MVKTVVVGALCLVIGCTGEPSGTPSTIDSGVVKAVADSGATVVTPDSGVSTSADAGSGPSDSGSAADSGAADSGVATRVPLPVLITAPVAGATLGGTVTVTATFGSAVKNVEFFSGAGAGALVGRALLSGDNATFSWDTTAFADGQVELFAKAWDAIAGLPANETQSQRVTVTVHNVATDAGTVATMWSALSVLQVVNPLNYGAVGNGTTDDRAALVAAIDALPSSGGIVFFPAGKTFRKNDLITITKSHVKFWSVNRQATLFGAVQGQTRHQSMLCRGTDGCGFYGLKLTSDATARFDALEDNQLSFDQGTNVEVIGNEIAGSAAAGMFLYGSQGHFIEGNYVHHTYADHIHHTNAAARSWVWDNFIYNEAPSKGDDGVACVTYGESSTRCADMEWFNNTILKSGWGRGYSVIGGDRIDIHDNWAIGVAGAGVIVASEPSYHSASSNGVTIKNNKVYQCGQIISHPGILISGANGAAGPITDVQLNGNVSVASNGNYGTEGSLTNVANVGFSTALADLGSAIPSTASVKLRDTTILKIRDTSFVATGSRPGLYRIHVRQKPGQATFEQRFEYVFSGTAGDVAAYLSQRTGAGDVVSGQALVGAKQYAVLFTANPLQLPGTLTPVSFADLRKGDRDASLSWLWVLLNG